MLAKWWNDDQLMVNVVMINHYLTTVNILRPSTSMINAMIPFQQRSRSALRWSLVHGAKGRVDGSPQAKGLGQHVMLVPAMRIDCVAWHQGGAPPDLMGEFVGQCPSIWWKSMSKTNNW